MFSFGNSSIVTRDSRVSRTPPHHTLPRFSKSSWYIFLVRIDLLNNFSIKRAETDGKPKLVEVPDELPFEVPIIDYKNLPSDKSIQDKLFKGLTDVGFLVLANHGMPDALIKKVHKISTQFYSCTHEQRIRVANESKIMMHEGSAFTTTPFKNSE